MSKNYFSHESSYIDNNVLIGANTKIGTSLMYNQVLRLEKIAVLDKM